MGISVLIASTTRNSLVAPASLSLTKTLGEAATAQITLRDSTGSVVPVVGNAVEIQDQASDVQFFGSINEVTVRRLDHLAANECSISATDLNHACTRRNAGQYEWIDKTVLYIVSDIVSNSLSGDLTDVSLVETGPTIPSFATNYPTVKEAFDALAELAGMRWYVDELNRLNFFTPSVTADAPFAITDGTNVTALSMRATREDYCNKVTARVGNALRDPDTESFVGNSVLTSFELAYPVAQAPLITLDGAAQTVGITGVDTGKDWYWNSGSKEIRQDSGGTLLTAGNTLAVTYVGVEEIIVGAENAGEISARATAEGNSGIYQRHIEIEAQLTRTDAQAQVDAYLDRYSALTYVLTAETNEYLEPDILTIRPGDVLNFTRSGYGATGLFLVRSVTLDHIDGATDQSTYQWRGRMELVQGPILRGYADMFKASGGGSVSGGGAVTTNSGAGVYVYEPAKLVANTTITSPYAATRGATLVVFVKQGASPYTISFDATQFAQVVNTNIPATEDLEIAFPFVGRGDGLWWPMSFARVQE